MKNLCIILFLSLLCVIYVSAQTVEVSPLLSEPKGLTTNNTEAQWDVLFNYDLAVITGGAGNAGVVYIPTLQQFWVSRWSTPAGRIYVISKTGAIVDSFTTSGFTGTRGMTFDGTDVYCGNGTSNMFRVDPVTRATLATIPLPTAQPVQTRFITFDPTADGGLGGFWCGNWTSPNLHFYLVSRTGSLLRTINSTITGVYGLAFDNWSTGGPFLWAWSQGAGAGTAQLIHQISVTTGLATGVTKDVKTDVGAGQPTTGIAGGLFITHQHTTGKVILGGVMQGSPDLLFGYELVVLATPPLNAFNLTAPAAGITITAFPGSPTPVTITWDTSTAFATYKWVLGSPTVPPRLVTIPRSTNSLTFTLGQLDSILAANGVAQGSSLVGQWNVWAFRNNPPANDSLVSANGPRAITLTRGVPPLTNFNLVSPPNAATIVTSKFNTAPVIFNWRKSGEGVTYRWKFGSPTISTVIFNYPANNSGYDTVYSIANSSLDALLAARGLNPGDSINGQWAAWAYRTTDSLKSILTFNVTLKRQGIGSVLVVYDSTAANGRISRDSVVSILNGLGVTYDLQNKGTSATGPVFTMRGYKKVIWLGEATSTITVAQRDSIKAYLNAGGTTAATKSKLIIFSEDIGYNHRSAGTYPDVDLINNYLGFNYVADRPGGVGTHGLIGMAINNGLADSTVGSWPDVLVQFGTGTDALYRFRRHTAPDSICGIGKIGATFAVATITSDIRALRSAIDSPPGSPVNRILRAVLNYVDQTVVDIHDIGVFSLGLWTAKNQTTESKDAPVYSARSQNNGATNADDKIDSDIKLALSAFSSPSFSEVIQFADSVNFKAVVRNYGTYIEPTYQVRWSVNGVPQTAVNNTTPLAINGTADFSLKWGAPTPGTNTIRAWTYLATDTNPVNDTATFIYEILEPNIILQEGFNGTTFPPTGWLTINADDGGTTGPWFRATGPTPFTPFEGAAFAADNYQSANGYYIDDYLITPNTGGIPKMMAVDSLTFWLRSPTGSTWPDSLDIRISTTGINVNDFTQRVAYILSPTTAWTRFAFAIPLSEIRYIAFRYLIYDGGVSGTNSYYIGLDDVRITRYTVPATGNWAAQTSGITTVISSVKAVNPSVAWAAGAGGRVLLTTNGGTNWTSVTNTSTLNNHNIGAIDANTAFVLANSETATADARIYKTTNGGLSWTMVYQSTATGAFLNIITMFDANNGIAQGDPVGGKWTILRTSDGGNNWARIATEPVQVGTEAGWNNSMSVVGNTHIWFGTSNSRVYRSTDGGTTWSSSPVAFANGYGIWFNDKNIGVVAGNGIARTTDGGATWSSITGPGTGDVSAVAGAGAPDFWYARGTGIYRSADNGLTWTLEYTGVGTQWHLNFVKAGPWGWTVSSTGAIARFTPPVGVDDGTKELPKDFVLMQNYPNPFNPSTNIKFALPEASIVTVEVYNILGQKVKTLINDERPAGYHVIEWNGRNKYDQFAGSGVYYFRISAEGNSGKSFTQVRKMLLLK